MRERSDKTDTQLQEGCVTEPRMPWSEAYKYLITHPLDNPHTVKMVEPRNNPNYLHELSDAIYSAVDRVRTLEAEALIHRRVVDTDFDLPIHFSQYIPALESRVRAQEELIADSASEAEQMLREIIDICDNYNIGYNAVGTPELNRVLDKARSLLTTRTPEHEESK
jgi:hypothetical protein